MTLPKKQVPARKISTGGKSKPAAKDPVHQPSRHRFSLEWQHRGHNEPLLGVIEYPITGDKATFQGIDTVAIAQFVRQFTAPLTKKPEPVPVAPALPAPAALSFATTEGLPLEESLFEKNTALEVRLQLATADGALKPGEATFMAKVYAQSLDSGDRILLATQQGFVADTGEIALAIGLDALLPGSYRVVSDVDLHTAGGIRRMAGSRLMHLVA